VPSGEYTLRPDEAFLPSGEPCWQALIWSGVAVGPDSSGVIRISSPLLLRALIIAVTDSGGLPSDLPPFPSKLSSRYGPRVDARDHAFREHELPLFFGTLSNVSPIQPHNGLLQVCRNLDAGARFPVQTNRLFRPELQKLNDSQPLEWPVSYDLGTTMEKCLYSTAKGMNYCGLPGARLPQPGYLERQRDGTATAVDVEKRARGPPPQLDWLFANGDMPKAS